MDVVKLWEKVKKTMKRKISEGEFELFFENVKAEKIEDNIFTLTCNSKLIKESVEKYRSQMEEIVEIVTDEEIIMKFEVKKNNITIVNIRLIDIFFMWKSMWKTFFQNLDYLFYICYS